MYFSKIIRGMSNSGMSRMLSVFSRAFLIQYSPLISFIMCSYRKCCTSVKASPVSAQNTNMSLTVCRRGMVNSFFRSMFNSSSVRNARAEAWRRNGGGDTFYRGDASRSGEGNGPGLAPTSKVVEPAASSFMVESEKGKGFAFRVRLPVSREKTVL